MTTLALYASPYENNGIDNSKDNLLSKKRLNYNHNKTQKYHNRDNIQSEKVRNIIKKIHDNSIYNDSIDGVEMGDFAPLSPPESAGVNRTIDKSSFKENYSSISIDDDNDNDNYNSSKNKSVEALNHSNNSNYYSIQTDGNNNSNNSNNSNNNNDTNSSMQQRQIYDSPNTSKPANHPNHPNHPNASNYLDSIEYNNLNNNYGDNKSTEEYYKKFSPNYSYGTVSNWNRMAQSHAHTNSNNINKKIYANGSIDNNYSTPFSPSLMESSSSPTNIENSILIEKLNYMIHLLEEQQDERTNNVTEEVILYCFLGIFMIFIVDSFTRVGKYVR
uniref:Uncharacterized protein n=1 Tax=viral metagenome TaxID=1070528 RepID=A0A6C0E495_9ZZZZ